VDNSYPDDVYQDIDYEAPEPKKGMSGWLIALIVLLVFIVLCCVCLFGVLVMLGPAVGNTFSTIVGTLEATTPMP
jgi:hypothetical protein